MLPDEIVPGGKNPYQCLENPTPMGSGEALIVLVLNEFRRTKKKE
jgi:hypothetical protein